MSFSFSLSLSLSLSPLSLSLSFSLYIAIVKGTLLPVTGAKKFAIYLFILSLLYYAFRPHCFFFQENSRACCNSGLIYI